MDKNILIICVVFAVVAVFVWSISTIAAGKNTSTNSETYKYYQNLQQQSQTGCGDLNDLANIQHLSHHPDQYAECIKKVSPEKFKEAVGEDRDGFLKNRGL